MHLFPMSILFLKMRSRRSENNGISGSFPNQSGKSVTPNESNTAHDVFFSLTNRLTLGVWKFSASISHCPRSFCRPERTPCFSHSVTHLEIEQFYRLYPSFTRSTNKMSNIRLYHCVLILCQNMSLGEDNRVGNNNNDQVRESQNR